MIRVVVVEDSPTASALLLAVLAEDPLIEVVGTARDGIEAVELTLQLRPDLVTMDVHMPRLDGLSATREIMRLVPTPILIVTASARDDEVTKSFSALESGALAVVDKPVDPGHVAFEAQVAHLREMIHSMASVKVVRDRRHVAPALPTPAPSTRSAPVRLVAIAASTGGPPALLQVLRGIPRGLPAPLLIVQHIATGFVAGFASWLAQASGHPVEVAQTGRTAEPGVVFVAPDGAHLEITPDGRLRLASSAPVRGHRPSAERLFLSVAQSGIPAAAVILTGMGSDGSGALPALRSAGARILAQDEESSVVFGMPRAAAETGLVDEILPLWRIGSRLNALIVGAH